MEIKFNHYWIFDTKVVLYFLEDDNALRKKFLIFVGLFLFTQKVLFCHFALIVKLCNSSSISVGTEFRSVSDELISSFQFLLGAIDLCFKNALTCEHRTSLLNPIFPGNFIFIYDKFF